MDLGLEGRTAIVCGASSGMGLGIAESLAGEGANVVMFARRKELLEREADRLGGLAVAGDVTSADDLERLVSTAVEAFGFAPRRDMWNIADRREARLRSSPRSKSRQPRSFSSSPSCA